MANTSDKPKIKPAQAQPSEQTADNTQNIPEIWGKFGKVIKIASRSTEIVGVIAVIFLVSVIVMDVLGSKFFHAPFPGFIGVLGFVQLVAISFAMGATYLAGHHIKIDLILARLPKKPLAIVNTIVYFISFSLFVVIVWRLLVLAKSFQDSGEVLDQVLIPMYPVLYAVAIAFVPVCLALFYQLGNSFNRMVRK